jgi:hypothetical protein
MISLQRSIIAAALTVVSIGLTSCGTGSGPIAAHNPTIQQMDDLDVQWGLQRRTPRGGTTRRYSGVDTTSSSAGANTTAPKKTDDAARTATPPAESKAQGAVDPGVIQSLR